MAADTQWPMPFDQDESLPGYPPERKAVAAPSKRRRHLLRFFGVIGTLLPWFSFAVFMGFTQGPEAGFGVIMLPIIVGAILLIVTMVVWFIWDVTSGEL